MVVGGIVICGGKDPYDKLKFLRGVGIFEFQCVTGLDELLWLNGAVFLPTVPLYVALSSGEDLERFDGGGRIVDLVEPVDKS